MFDYEKNHHEERTLRLQSENNNKQIIQNLNKVKTELEDKISELESELEKGKKQHTRI